LKASGFLNNDFVNFGENRADFLTKLKKFSAMGEGNKKKSVSFIKWLQNLWLMP
tara:strand:- start:500 stop:661 length:162 start_codon:yes stop_codon:yes gene_type:complete